MAIRGKKNRGYIRKKLYQKLLDSGVEFDCNSELHKDIYNIFEEYRQLVIKQTTRRLSDSKLNSKPKTKPKGRVIIIPLKK